MKKANKNPQANNKLKAKTFKKKRNMKKCTE